MPDLFIVGAARSGTSSLHEWLKRHPEIRMSVVKEPNYFAPDLLAEGDGRTLRYGDNLDLYLELFPDADNAKWVGEASVRYLYSKQAPQLIRAAQPDARIVVALRNPVDMAYSLHSHHVSGGSEDIMDFEAAIAAEEDRHAGRRIPPNANPRLSTYKDRARYGEQLPRWFEAFGRDRVFVTVFEELVTNPAAEFRRLLQFLEVDPEYQPPRFSAHNTAHGTRSRRLRALLDGRAPQWIVLRLLPRLIGDKRTRNLVARFRQSRLHRRPMERAPLSADVRRRLESEFEPDVARTSELVGRDLRALWFGGLSTARVPTVAEARPDNSPA